jgi:hypothetical protein
MEISYYLKGSHWLPGKRPQPHDICRCR